jgi:pyruvate dehydrogenase phosphatase regulatory subunit
MHRVRGYCGLTSQLRKTLTLKQEWAALSPWTVSDPLSMRRWQSTSEFPAYSQVVICGGGVIGASVAYHLTQHEGWNDVVLLEQGSSTACGTTWHAGGLIGRQRYIKTDAIMSIYSSNLYRELQNEGFHTGWKQCGSLNLARTKDRLIAYKRALQHGERFGLVGDFLTPEEIKDRYPFINIEEIQGGFLIPEDGVASPTDLTNALVNKAKKYGARVFTKCKVEKVLTRRRKVTGVQTSLGFIECKYFVNCAGQWAREL